MPLLVCFVNITPTCMLGVLLHVGLFVIHWWLCPLHFCGVRTDAGKVWEVPEFNIQIFKALKSPENMEKFGKILEKCNASLESTCLLYWVMKSLKTKKVLIRVPPGP